ncbi:MarR family winged helix-turn-helix transcriptional regulator [Umezawaea tangerina]|uniref:MarR family winged helix-turn-helix transcriptional regulator n=1 Tax=Umezawaea tangerina TaxID=84725 RepID=UPI0011B23CAA|nr:MarR family transcriptional regulator [Umezawaea tangerina]
MTTDSPVPHLRDLLQVMAVRQQWFERSMATALGIDRTGLEVVYHLIARGPSTPTDLARAAGLSTAATAQVLKRLEAGGHIRRAKHDSDRRKMVIAVDPGTEALANRYVAPVIEGLDGLLGAADADTREKISSFLRGVADVYTRALPEHPATGAP